jgi:type I restriction enzyme S subunit
VESYDRQRVPLSGREREKRPGTTPYYGASGVIDHVDGYTHEGNFLLVAEDGENLRSRKTPIAFLATGKFWANNHVHVMKVLDAEANEVFLAAALENLDIGGWITGAAQPKLTQGDLMRIPIPCPSLPTQRTIAAVLAAYDELIENNLRRAEILDEMAARLYREWLVNARDPGRSEGGDGDFERSSLPEGWREVELFAAAEVGYGFAFRSELFRGEPPGDRVVRIRDIPRGTTKTYTSEVTTPRYRIRDGDILVGMDGDFHLGIWADGPAVLNQRVARIRPKGELPILHLFNLLRQPISELNRSITGTTVAHLGDRHLRELSIVIPPQDVIGQTRQLLDPMLLLARNLHKQTANLRAARDLLLPRLVSGAIEVSELDPDSELLAS